jgi:DNA primase catalytic subunit
LRLDDHLKALLRELGHAINDSVADSERIAEAIGNVRAAGYDIVLKLDATIGLAQRPSSDERMTTQDRRFLESLHIRVDEEVLDEQVENAKVEITPQDIKFLKSLKISLDNEA